MARPRVSAPDHDDLLVLERFKRKNPSGGYSKDGVVADVVNRAAIATDPWAPNTGKVFISDVYDTIVRQGADDGVSLEELKHELVRLHKLGLLELARADLVAAMPAGKVARSETDAGGATFHFIVRPRQNPYVGSHPDLFAGSGIGGVYPRRPGPPRRGKDGSELEHELHRPVEPAALRAMHGALSVKETPMFVPLSDLTSEQIRELKRSQFTDEEWGELDEDDREYIVDNDEESQARVDALAEPFIKDYKWEAEVDDSSAFSRVEEHFEAEIRAKATDDALWEWMPDAAYQGLVRYAEQHDLEEADVDTYLNEILANTNQYTFTTERGGHIAWSMEIEGNVFMNQDAWETPLAACTPDEVERAIEKIYQDTDHEIDLDVADLHKRYYDHTFETGVTVYAKLETESVADDCRSAIDQRVEELEYDRRQAEEEMADDADPEGAADPEERIVYRWPDGFCVLDLLPSELPAEGKAMGMCVGRPDMGYGRAVRAGEIKILSVRRPSGKPLFTIEAELDYPARPKGSPMVLKIARLQQVKGKANRLPGFDLGKTAPGTPLKKDEVVRIYELVEGPGGLGEKFGLEQAVDDVQDLKPAAREVNRLAREGDKWARDLLVRLGIDDAQIASWRIGAEGGIEPPRENPGPACGLHDEKCTGFCRPYRKRNPARGNNEAAMERITKARVLEPLRGETIEHQEPVELAIAGTETWDLVCTTGTRVGGVGRAGRILIVLPGGKTLEDPLAGLAYSIEHGRPYVHHVWVDADVRRRGISHVLFDAFRTHVSPDLVVVGPFTRAGRAAALAAGATIENPAPDRVPQVVTEVLHELKTKRPEIYAEYIRTKCKTDLVWLEEHLGDALEKAYGSDFPESLYWDAKAIAVRRLGGRA